jgi:N-acetylglucosaminyldiphosphoundecaprenol N-acetyl-beta-D-mannosaminyltransferase
VAGPVLGIVIDRISRADAAALICSWASAHAARSVLLVNVHMTMEAVDDPAFRTVMRTADLALADGTPLFWTLRSRGYRDVRHVRGQDLVLEVCAQAEAQGLRLGLYGTTDAVLSVARAELASRFPKLEIVYAYAPPFRPLSEEEDRAVVEAIAASGAQILLVALGCPKQEKWMAAHRDAVPAVMIGAGAAIDMLGGLQPVAPRWMQASGLEWLFRLASDPARLWRRYARHNLRFLVLSVVESLRGPAAAERAWREPEELR